MADEPKISLIDVSDLPGLSKPLKKLIGVVSAGIGRVADVMWFAKRDADNEAYRTLKIGDAETRVVIGRMQAVADLTAGSGTQIQKLTLVGNEVGAKLSDGQKAVLALKERADSKAEYQNLIHQLNTEQTVRFAAEKLAEEGTTVSEQPVDEDWITRFFSIAQDVSNEEFQAMWGKILAGEIKKPQSFSLRTLETLRNLTSREADLFNTACKYLIVSKTTDTTRSHKLYRNPENSGVFGEVGYSEVLELIDCGLVQPAFTNSIGLDLSGNVNIVLQLADKVLVVRGEIVTSENLQIEAYKLTKAGAEISSLINAEAPIEYVKQIANLFPGQRPEIWYAKFNRWSDDNEPFYNEPRVIISDGGTQ